MSLFDKKEKQEQFLHSLTNTTTTYLPSTLRDVSIQLIESRDPQDYQQGVFTLELACGKSIDSGEHEYERHSLVLTKKGIRDPTSEWPVYRFLVDDSQRDFLWDKLLPALKTATTATEASTPQLTTLTVKGFGRVPGFYTQLMQCIGDSQSLKSLSILNWADFIGSVDANSFASLPVLSRLEHFSAVYPKVDPTTSTALALNQALNSMSQLRTLNLETGVAARSLMVQMCMKSIKKMPMF
jgi:hypothetical protein